MTKIAMFDLETELDKAKNISAFLSTVADVFSNSNSHADMGINDWEGLSAVLSAQSEKFINIKKHVLPLDKNNSATYSNYNNNIHQELSKLLRNASTRESSIEGGSKCKMEI